MSKSRILLITLITCVVVLTFGALFYRRFVSVGSISAAKDQLPTLKHIVAGPDDWYCWRGPLSTGVNPSATPVIEWSTTQNVKWSLPYEGRGHSSPIVWSDRVFLTSANDQKQTQSLMCLSLQSGALQWVTEIHKGLLPVKHDKNSHASATPICDGTHVFTTFAIDDAVWCTAVTMDGEIVWQTKTGPFVSFRGYGSSPALYGPLIIVAADNRGSKLARLKVSSFLAAVNRHDGSIVWRIHRPQEHSFSSPIVADVAGKHQLLLGGPSLIASYDPLSGDLFWSCESGASRTANTLAFSDNTVFSSATQTNSEVIAIRADGNGKVKSSHVVWEKKRGAGDVPSPLWYGGFLYVLSDKGVLTCFASETGKILWRKRLPGRYSSSPVIGGDHLFATNEHGTTYVLTLGDNSELVQKNELQEPVFASVVFTGQLTLIRSSNHLWCLQHNQTVSEQPEL